MKTVALLFHPNLAGSRANRALAEATSASPGLETVHMESLYPDGRIDVDAEVSRLISADRLILQFPIQWYSTPPLLKAWQDAVLTRMFYVNPATEGALVEGLPLKVVVTAGNREAAYAPTGVNLFPLDELLKPLRATANRCGFIWSEPFLLYEANKRSSEELRDAGQRYAADLKGWFRAPLGHRPSRPFVPSGGQLSSSRVEDTAAPEAARYTTPRSSTRSPPASMRWAASASLTTSGRDRKPAVRG